MTTRVEVSARLIEPPHACVCCRDEPTTKIRADATRDKGDTKSYAFPACARCARHSEAWVSAWTSIKVGMGLTIVLAPLAACGFGGTAGALTAVIGIGGSLALFFTLLTSANGLRTRGCAGARPVVFVGWHGTVLTFDFASWAYAVQFAKAHHRKLVNVSDRLWRALEDVDPPRRIGPTD